MMEEVAVTAMSAGADAAAPAGPPESASALPPPENSGAALFAARPSLIRAMNEQLLLEHIRQRGPCSRAELARVSGLSKPTVSLALDNVERAGLVGCLLRSRAIFQLPALHGDDLSRLPSRGRL